MTTSIINKFDIIKYDFIPIINIKDFFDLSKKNKDFSIKKLDIIFNNYRITYNNNLIYKIYYDTKTLILDDIIRNTRRKSGGSNNFCSDNDNSDDIIKNYMNGVPEASRIIDKYPEIKDMIDKQEKKKLEIIIDSKVGYINKSNYEFYDFNKDMILAFEKNFIDNIENMNKYIDRQNTYILSLSKKEQYILYDYSNKYTCSVYRKFKNNNKEWIEDIKKIGDAFLPQISKILGNKIKLPTIRNTNSTSLFEFDIKTWIKVLNTFTDDLDKIIRKSPKLEDDIYCYRGCSNYEYNSGVYTEKDAFKLKFYKYYIPIPTSFTLSYEIAKNYYDSKLGFPMLYRITIMKGCNALFISNDDFEIIIPSYSIVAKSSIGGDYLGFNKNDRNNIYGICENSSKNILKSMDIIITSTSKFKHSLDIKLLVIDKPEKIDRIYPNIIIFNFTKIINENDRKYKTYLNNIIKELEYLGFILIEKTNNNFIFLKSHIFHILDIKTIEEKSAYIITIIHNNKEIKLGVFDKYIDKYKLDIIIENDTIIKNY